jgi:hypothetical protein
LTWAQRLKRAFEFDVTDCPLCGGTLRVIAGITDPAPGNRPPSSGEAPAFACAYDSRIRVISLSTNIVQPCYFHIAVKTALIFPIGLQRFTQCVRQHLALFYLSIREPWRNCLIKYI